MFDPRQFPYQRITYQDKNPPYVKAEEFYNPVQDSLALLFGASVGLSASIATEEFVTIQESPITTGNFGSQLHLVALANTQTRSSSTLDFGRHGVWKVSTQTDGLPFLFSAFEPACFFGSRQFLFSATLSVPKKSNLDPVSFSPGQSGFLLGLSQKGPAFVLGSDQKNWFVLLDGKLYDTKQEAVEDIFYVLSIFRTKEQQIGFFFPGLKVPTLLLPSPPDLVQGSRYLLMKGNSLMISGPTSFFMDSYSRLVER